MDTFLFLLGAFGALTLALSAVLVANMIHALLGEQVRQVGVMKAIGATTRQVAALYLGQVALLAAVALCIGMPLGLWAGRGYAALCGRASSTRASSRTAVPAGIIAVEIAVGLVRCRCWSPSDRSFARRASRSTRRSATTAARRPFGSRRLDRWLARVRWLPRPLLLLAAPTGLDRRGRLALTVATLAAGGAVFRVGAERLGGLEPRPGVGRAHAPLRPGRAAARALSDRGRSSPPSRPCRRSRTPSTGPTRRADLAEGGGGEARVSLVAPDTGSTLLAPLLVGRPLARAAATVASWSSTRDFCHERPACASAATSGCASREGAPGRSSAS